MADIVLINPHWYMAQANLDDLWLPIPNGLASVAAALRHKGHLVMIIDALAEGYGRREWIERNGRRICRIGLSEADLFERIKRHNADVIGIGNMFTAVFSSSVECASIARRAMPAARIVMGGVHPSCVPKEVANVLEVDYVLCGEGEIALPALINYIKNGPTNSIPPGIFWREDGVIKTSGSSLVIQDMDMLPMPAYDLLDIKLYRDAAKTDLISRGKRGVLTIPIITSRGCPYGCIFCASHRINGRRWRGSSPEKVVDEIEFLNRHHGVDSFTIEDSNFSFNEERAVAICEEIVERGIRICWNTPNGLRADRISQRLVKAMRRSGCYEIILAAEHGDQGFLKRVVGKGLDLDDILRAAGLIIKEGISVSCFLMMGFPGETKRELASTVAFGRRLARQGIFPLFFICTPFPGTAMYQSFVEKGYLPEQLLSSEEYLCSFRIPLMKMPEDIDLCQWRHRAMWQAYLLFLLRHPISFSRLPAFRKFLFSLTSPRKFWLALIKVYNQFFIKTECLAGNRGFRDFNPGRGGEVS